MTDEAAPLRDDEIRPFDIVRIRPEALSDKSIRMTPKDLCRMGWPKLFMVMKIFINKGKVCLELDPCCNWMRHLKTDEILCRAHPAEHFEKVADARSPHDADRYMLAHWPWGELFSLEYLADPKNPALRASAFGSPPVTIMGELGKLIAEGIRARGIL